MCLPVLPVLCFLWWLSSVVTTHPSVTLRVVAMEPFVKQHSLVFLAAGLLLGNSAYEMARAELMQTHSTCCPAQFAFVGSRAEESGFFPLFLSSCAGSWGSVDCFHVLCKELHRIVVFSITVGVFLVLCNCSLDLKGSSWLVNTTSLVLLSLHFGSHMFCFVYSWLLWIKWNIGYKHDSLFPSVAAPNRLGENQSQNRDGNY